MLSAVRCMGVVIDLGIRASKMYKGGLIKYMLVIANFITITVER